MPEPTYLTLANYHACVTRLHTAWPTFLKTRDDRLRHGDESEKVAEAIIEDLLTGVLDWGKGDLVYQIEYADIVLSQNLQKYLVKGIPESDVADVLLRLARAAKSAQLLPPESIHPAPIYQQLVLVLEQNDLLAQL